MCRVPSRLVWPILAVALAGRSTSPLSRIVTSACQPCRSILVTVPTVTSFTRTRELGWIFVTSGSWACTSIGTGPAALGARQRQRVQAAPAASSETGCDDYDGHADLHSAQRFSGHRPTLWGTIMPGKPSAGLVATVASAGSGALSVACGGLSSAVSGSGADCADGSGR